MFNSLFGIVTECHTGYFFLLSADSIEWMIFASDHTLASLSSGKKERILIHTQFKEDDVSLFGFYSEKERMLFKNLIKVNGIGPKAAIKTISRYPIEEFLSALEMGDTTQIASIPGIGKKTAEKIIFTLKGKIEPELAGSSGQKTLEIVESLVAMGFERRQCQKVILELQAQIGGEENSNGESLLIQQAIIKLSSKGIV